MIFSLANSNWTYIYMEIMLTRTVLHMMKKQFFLCGKFIVWTKQSCREWTSSLTPSRYWWRRKRGWEKAFVHLLNLAIVIILNPSYFDAVALVLPAVPALSPSSACALAVVSGWNPSFSVALAVAWWWMQLQLWDERIPHLQFGLKTTTA